MRDESDQQFGDFCEETARNAAYGSDNHLLTVEVIDGAFIFCIRVIATGQTWASVSIASVCLTKWITGVEAAQSTETRGQGLTEATKDYESVDS